MNPIILAGPAVEPVSLSEMRAYLRVDGTDEDDLVAALIVSARLTIEAALRIALVEQTWRVRARRRDGAAVLPMTPLVAVVAVRTVRDGVATLLDPARYEVQADRDPPRVVVSEPGIGRVEIDARYGFGPGAGDVPGPLRLAVRQLAAHWFEHRGDGPDAAPPRWPASVGALVAPFARPRLA